MHPSNGQFTKDRHACWPIQCRQNPIEPRIDLTAEMNRAYSMIQSRHNGSVTPKSFTSIQGMRVRNHCFLLSHEVMGILTLMALGSRQWYCISSCNYSNSRFPFSSHATTTTRTTSLKWLRTVERIHCKIKESVWLKHDWVWAGDSRLGRSISWRWTDWNTKFRACYWLQEHSQLNSK